MSLAPGARVGPYEIVAQIGVGGMGEVYRATDTGLSRDVAIKVLPDEFAQDVERLARFEREARTLASLNHPGIAILHGVERTSGSRALVMEFVDGPTLADRIAAGPLPVDEALAIAMQIAEAVSAAHELGVVHRDLKPANIKLRSDGTVKVLDFGLAKTIEPVGASTGKSMSPTITSPAMTQAGVILGTAAYMAPEQAKGQGADKRSDVWALGCVVYEMLTGRRAFDGDDVSDTLALILRGQPEWSALPADLPPAVTSLVKRMLEKDRRRRVADLATISYVLSEPGLLSEGVGGRDRNARTAPARIAAAVMIGAALASGGWWAATRSGSDEPKRVTRLVVPLQGDEQLLSPAGNALALSPAGTHLAFVANGRVYLRALDQLESVVVRGTESNVTAGGATRAPRFSPDGKWLGFIKDGQMRKVAIGGGAPVAIAPTATIANFTWEADGSIVFLSDRTLFRMPDTGGNPVPIAEGLTGLLQNVQMLPGGNRVLLSRVPEGTIDPGRFEIVVRSIADGRETIILRGGAAAHYLPTGHVVYFSNGSLLAARLDLEKLSIIGAPEPVADQVLSGSAPGLPIAAVHVAVSSTGMLAYIRGDAPNRNVRSLVWVDRSGREESLGLRDEPYVYPRLSPNGRFIGVTMRQEVRGDIWILDVLRKTARPLTTEPSDERYVTWTPDSARVAFGSVRGDDAATWWQAADGTGTAQRVAGFPRSRFANFIPTSVTPTGDHLVVTSTSAAIGADLWLVPLRGGEPAPLVHTPATERNGEISPDGRWLAYEAIETGLGDVFVRPFPNVDGGKWRVSNGGGSQPLWSRDSRELFYLDAMNVVTGVTIEKGSSWTTSAPTKILPRSYISYIPSYGGRQYDVSRDGKKFLMMKDVGAGSQAGTLSITIVQNWFEELRRR